MVSDTTERAARLSVPGDAGRLRQPGRDARTAQTATTRTCSRSTPARSAASSTGTAPGAPTRAARSARWRRTATGRCRCWWRDGRADISPRVWLRRGAHSGLGRRNRTDVPRDGGDDAARRRRPGGAHPGGAHAARGRAARHAADLHLGERAARRRRAGTRGAPARGVVHLDDRRSSARTRTSCSQSARSPTCG